MVRSKALLPAPESEPMEEVPRNFPLSRQFCAVASLGELIPSCRSPFEECLGFAVASKHLASVTFGACDEANDQTSASSTMGGQTLGDLNHGLNARLSADHLAKLCNVPSLSSHTTAQSRRIDRPLQHSKVVPTTSNNQDSELFEQLCIVAGRYDEAGDPFEPLPLEHIFAGARNAP